MTDKWFAWHPVKTVGGHWVWLTQVTREWDWSLNPYCDPFSGYSDTDGGWKYS